jgi:hypothetical protein
MEGGIMEINRRKEHCHFAILDSYQRRCIAICHRQTDGVDCIGEEHETPEHEFESDLQKRRID